MKEKYIKSPLNYVGGKYKLLKVPLFPKNIHTFVDLFGGGFIKDNYQDYGYLGKKEDGSPKYNMYELLAFWNSEMVYNPVSLVKEHLQYDEVENGIPVMKEIDKYTCKNRSIGIDIGCYRDEIDRLKYPLKLVSASFKGCYEDLDKPNYGDPNQGFGNTRRKRNE